MPKHVDADLLQLIFLDDLCPHHVISTILFKSGACGFVGYEDDVFVGIGVEVDTIGRICERVKRVLVPAERGFLHPSAQHADIGQ